MRFNGMRVAVLTAGFAMCCGQAVLAQESSDTSAQDKTFLAKSSEGGMAEITLARLALKKSRNDDVKAFAQKMIDDHTRLMSDMKPFCEKMGVPPPAKLNQEHQMEQKRLMGLSGDKFVMEYIKAMVGDHHKDLGEFKAEEAATSNPDLKSTVSQGTQVIQQHTEMIDQMAQKNGISTPPVA